MMMSCRNTFSRRTIRIIKVVFITSFVWLLLDVAMMSIYLDCSSGDCKITSNIEKSHNNILPITQEKHKKDSHSDDQNHLSLENDRTMEHHTEKHAMKDIQNILIIKDKSTPESTTASVEKIKEAETIAVKMGNQIIEITRGERQSVEIGSDSGLYGWDVSEYWEGDDNPKVGPGEAGRGVTIDDDAGKAKVKELWSVNQFNLYVSDMIALNRSIPDIRHSNCRKKEHNYPKQLPDTSVVVVFHNEAWSTLLRTVTSVINRSPRSLLKEIIIVDDASTREHLGLALEQFVADLSVPVRVVRQQKRVGLIRARLAGAEVATGGVITFLDSHCEATRGWLPPLLSEIAVSRSTVAVPVIDTINDDTFAYQGNSETAFAGGFNWRLEFRWYDMSKAEQKRVEGDPSLPFDSPTMAGGLFSIDREYFYESGSYDEGMDIWGAENLEMSFRLWQCGGRLVIVPCSHVGHVFRKNSPYSFPGGTGNTLTKNSRRLAEVWLDEYKFFWYQVNPSALSVDYGDLTSRFELRTRLGCKSFRWYIENVWPESQMNVDLDMIGELRSMEGDYCVDNMGYKDGEKAGLVRCHGQGGNQFFVLTGPQEIRGDEVCLDATNLDTEVHVYRCHGQGGNQVFHFHKNSKTVRHQSSDKCMDSGGADSGELRLRPCDGSPRQQWRIEPATKLKQQILSYRGEG